jgi:hypothetical protein
MAQVCIFQIAARALFRFFELLKVHRINGPCRAGEE